MEWKSILIPQHGFCRKVLDIGGPDGSGFAQGK